jgi:hypothetical protein
MSEQMNQAEQNTVSPQELRERMLEELEASKQAIAELSDEELEDVAGAGGFGFIAKATKSAYESVKKYGWKVVGGAALSATAVQTQDQLNKH